MKWEKYKDGRLSGMSGRFFSNGKPSFIKGTNEEGKNHGWNLMFAEDGTERKKYCYENGNMKLIGYYDPIKCDGMSVNEFIEQFRELTSEYF